MHLFSQCIVKTKSLCRVRYIWQWLFLILWPLTASAQIDANAVTDMGRNALSVDDYLTAIRYFNQAIEAKPFLSTPYYLRAYAKFTLEDYSGAEADCDKSLELNPFVPDVYRLRALCRIHNEKYAEAITDYHFVLSDSPADQGALYNKALCQLQLKNYQPADSSLTKLIQQRPPYLHAFQALAQSFMEQKDTLRAVALIDTLLTYSPNDVNAWDFKARYAMQKDQYELADSFATKAIALNLDNFDLYLLRAAARHQLDLFGKAIDDYDVVIRLCPTHFVAHYNRGLLRSFTGDLNRAILDFDFVLREEPDNTLALYNRAELKAAVGNHRGAVADYTSLLRQYPTFYYGYLQRAASYRKIGDTKRALADEAKVMKAQLDLSFSKQGRKSTKKVRERSDREIERYQALIEEDADTVRNIFGNLFGKLQNERVSDELRPMYIPTIVIRQSGRNISSGYMPEAERIAARLTGLERAALLFTADAPAGAADIPQRDEARLQQIIPKLQPAEQAILCSVTAMLHYDYTSALNEATLALRTDSASVLALVQHAHVLQRTIKVGDLSESEIISRQKLSASSLLRAISLAPDNAYLHYDYACLLAARSMTDQAIEAFTKALRLDPQLPEAYLNRGILYYRSGKWQEAKQDFSFAGQYGLHQAYPWLKRLRRSEKEASATSAP